MKYYSLVVTDQQGTPLKTLHDNEVFSDKEIAQTTCDDWNSFLWTKGQPRKIIVVEWKTNQ